MWHVDRRFCIVSDDGRGKYVIGSTLTDRPDPNDIKDVKYKSTCSMRNLLLLQADVRYECYENMVILHKLLKLETFPYPLTYSGDLKLLTAQFGLSGTSGYHSCPFCTGFRNSFSPDWDFSLTSMKRRTRMMMFLHLNIMLTIHIVKRYIMTFINLK